MTKKEVNLLEAAQQAGRIVRQGKLVQYIVDGGGSMVTSDQEYAIVEKWAKSKRANGSRVIDRNRFVDQFTVLVARPGSFVGTRGSTKYLEDLARLMKQGGFDLKEWQLPPELKDGK